MNAAERSESGLKPAPQHRQPRMATADTRGPAVDRQLEPLSGVAEAVRLRVEQESGVIRAYRDPLAAGAIRVPRLWQNNHANDGRTPDGNCTNHDHHRRCNF